MPGVDGSRPLGVRAVVDYLIIACAVYDKFRPAIETYFASQADVLAALHALDAACSALKALQLRMRNNEA